MQNKFQRREIGKEIYFSRITDPRFKLNLISVRFLAPISEETASENAVVSRILTKSCRKYPSFAILNNKLSALYAAKLGCHLSKFGDAQSVGITVSCIDNKYALENEDVNGEAADILIDCLFDPLLENGVFNEKTTSLERQVLIDDIEAELNDKQAYASHKADEIMCKGEPAAVRSLGSVKQAKLITAKSAYNAYQRLLTHCRIEIICVGCSDFEASQKKLAEAFTKLKRDEIFPCGSQYSPLKEAVAMVTEKMSVTQSKLVLGFKTDCKNIPALQMMSAIYGGTTTSKLFLNVREKMSLCYYCWSSISRTKGLMTVSSGVENENLETAKNEIIAQLDAMKKGDFTDEDIQHAKMYRRNLIKTVNDGISSMEAWYFTGIYNDDIKTPEQSVEAEEKVTREDIIEAAKSVKLDTVYILTSNDEEKED